LEQKALRKENILFINYGENRLPSGKWVKFQSKLFFKK
jgi:hypothetical protein